MTLTEQIQAALTKAQAIRAVYTEAERDPTDEELSQIEALGVEIEGLKAQVEAAERKERASQQMDATAGWLKQSAGPIAQPAGVAPESTPGAVHTPVVAAQPKRYGRLRHFHGPTAHTDALRFGHFMIAAGGGPQSIAYCRANGIPLVMATMSEGVNELGGVTVPEEFDPLMVNLREQYGIFRQFARIVPMGSDTKTRLRKTGGLTAYFVAEGGSITSSDATYDLLKLIAKDVATITAYTADLDEDSIISIADDLAGEIAYVFANKEDDCGFNGDGTETYGGIVGVRNALLLKSGTIANIAGLTVGSGDTWGELALADFEGTVANLPTFGDTPQAGWFVHKVFWGTVMVRLLNAAGGNTALDLRAGQPPQFMGYPVHFTQVMPKVTGVSQVCALLGDLWLAADFGDRKQTSIAMSKDAVVDSVSMFQTNQMAIRGIERFDINVHDVGNDSATAALREPGPVVGLITAAS